MFDVRCSRFGVRRGDSCRRGTGTHPGPISAGATQAAAQEAEGFLDDEAAVAVAGGFHLLLEEVIQLAGERDRCLEGFVVHGSVRKI